MHSPRYLSRVAIDAAIEIPDEMTMKGIAATDGRWYGKEVSVQLYDRWDDHMQKQGYQTGWRVARDNGRVICHIWFVMKEQCVTVLNVQACAYGATKIQVAAALLEAEDIFAALGAEVVCYLNPHAGTLYDEAYEVCGYAQENDRAKLPPGAFVTPSGFAGERMGVRWRRLVDGGRIRDERMQQVTLCLSAPNSSTPS